MAEATWDAIVIGSGVAGLVTGALLAKAGKKVLVLEKEKHIGGRACSTTYKGHVLDNGPHGPLSAVYLHEVFSRIGKPYPTPGTLTGKTEIYENGKWQDMTSLYPRAERRRIVEEIFKKSDREVEEYDDVPLEEWVKSQTDIDGLRKFFWFWGVTVMGGQRFEPISAGDFMSFVKGSVQKSGKMLMGGFLLGGMSSLFDPLVETIGESGGEIRTGTGVTNIVIKNGKAQGVEVEIGEKVIPSQVLDTELIEASVVVNTLPLWELFTLVSEDALPRWYVDWVKDISRRISHVWSVMYGLDEPLWDEVVTRWAPQCPRSKMMMIATAMPWYGESVGQNQLICFTQGIWDELPNPQNRDAKTKNWIREFFDLYEADIAELIPELKEHVVWKVRQAAVLGLAETQGVVGVHRPGVKVPAVDNLYLVSDSLKEAKLPGTQASAAAALVCADLVLGKKQ